MSCPTYVISPVVRFKSVTNLSAPLGAVTVCPTFHFGSSVWLKVWIGRGAATVSTSVKCVPELPVVSLCISSMNHQAPSKATVSPGTHSPGGTLVGGQVKRRVTPTRLGRDWLPRRGARVASGDETRPVLRAGVRRPYTSRRRTYVPRLEGGASMSSSLYRAQLEQKRKQRIDAERKAGELRGKESTERAKATKARSAAARATSTATASMRNHEAERAEAAAAAAGRDAARKQDDASRRAREEAALQKRLAEEERREAEVAERKRSQEQRRADQNATADRQAFNERLRAAEAAVDGVLRTFRPPREERLRILLLGSAAAGDLRVGREQKRIRAAVESALHRDLVVLDVRPAATVADLLDGITKFRPHVVHFSGHSDEQLIELEDERDEPHRGVIVTATAFSSAVRACDESPLLVLLNSCKSAAQLPDLVRDEIPLAIGMADEIDDGDAITYAAQFYAAVANGQSVGSSHASARAALELGGLDGAELPTLVAADGVDPRTVVLVRPPS